MDFVVVSSLLDQCQCCLAMSSQRQIKSCAEVHVQGLMTQFWRFLVVKLNFSLKHSEQYQVRKLHLPEFPLIET